MGLETVENFETILNNQHKDFSNAADINVSAAALTTLLECNVKGTSRMTCFVENTGSDAFSEFEIQYSVDQSYYETIYDVSGDFTTPQTDLVQTSDAFSLTVIPAGSTGYFQLITTGKLWVRIQAKGSSATTANSHAVAN
jgi:hypothetical protein